MQIIEKNTERRMREKRSESRERRQTERRKTERERKKIYREKAGKTSQLGGLHDTNAHTKRIECCKVKK